MDPQKPVTPGGIADKLLRLEDQVKGLMETVNQLHKAYKLDHLKIPKPDQYLRTGEYTVGEAQERLPGISPAPARFKPASTPQPATLPKSTPAIVSKSSPATETNKSLSASDVSSLAPYKYSPLNPEKSEIRILALQPSSSPTDPIICRLITTSLEHAAGGGRYTPLSYCWGTTFMTEKIVVDGHSFLVTPSLYNALLHFRSLKLNPSPYPGRRQTTDDSGLWWIDAICINQNDLDERKSQVSLMTRLYKQAQIVRVWLGEESNDSARAMQIIREVAYSPSSRADIVSWTYIRRPGQTHRPDGPGKPPVKLPEEPPAISADEKVRNYSAVINLYQRPWFSRVWVRQEIALPNEVTFHCGTETCSWVDLMKTADILAYFCDEYHLPDLQQPGLRNGVFSSCFTRAAELVRIRNSLGSDHDEYVELDSLVFDTRDCQSTDPRDKVYAMLPLTNPDKTDIAADYRKEYTEVYKALALSIITRSPDFLAGCQNPSRSNGLPSWVPNLEAPWNPSLAGLAGLGGRYAGHDKSIKVHYGTPDNDDPHITYFPERSRLDIEGIIFDEVRAIDQEDYVTADAPNSDVRTTVRRWWEFHSSQKERLSAEWKKVSNSNYDHKEKEQRRMIFIAGLEADWEQMLQTSCVQWGNRDDEKKFKPMSDRVIDLDPTFQRVKRLLLSDSTSYAKHMAKGKYLASLRRIAIGRRMIHTSRGICALAPAEARPGDKICFFVGSRYPFIIRDAGENTQVIVGQAHFFSKITLMHAKLSREIIHLI